MIGSQLRPSISSGRYVAVVVYIAAAKLVISFGLQSGKSKKVSFYPLPPVDNLVLAKAGEVPEETNYRQSGTGKMILPNPCSLAKSRETLATSLYHSDSNVMVSPLQYADKPSLIENCNM